MNNLTAIKSLQPFREINTLFTHSSRYISGIKLPFSKESHSEVKQANLALSC